jgi:hypothetical protein
MVVRFPKDGGPSKPIHRSDNLAHCRPRSAAASRAVSSQVTDRTAGGGAIRAFPTRGAPGSPRDFSRVNPRPFGLGIVVSQQ